MKPTLSYEDVRPGEKVMSAGVVVDRAELVAFAREWDPLPIHVDAAAGKAAFGDVTAPGIYMLALKQRLIHQLPERHEVIASVGYDEVRFHDVVRPGDTLTLVLEWVDKRPSRSRTDRGIVTLRLSLVNQAGTTVMSHLDTVLMRRHP